MERNGGINPSILYLGNRWRVVSVTSWSLYAPERYTATHGVRGWVVSTVSLDTLDKIKLFCP